MESLTHSILLLLLLALAPWAQAAEREVRIGILAFRPIEQTRQQWQPTADYLNARIPGHHFTIEPMFFPELDRAVDEKRFDFVLNNPEHYVTLRAAHGLTAIATLMPLAEGHPVSQFGGVIFTRADRADINTLADLRGKAVSAVGEKSFGAYMMQRWALFQQGIEIGEVRRLKFTGLPQDKVVREVLNGETDAGFVRTGIIESLQREGKLKPGQLKILDLQPAALFPQLLSTELYPEWAFSVMPGVPEQLTKAVSLALFRIRRGDAAAITGDYFGFTPPGNYAPVEAVMTRLRMLPGQQVEFDWRDVVRQYALALLAGALLLMLGVLAVVWHLGRQNAALLRGNHERARLQEELQQANARLESKVRQRTEQWRQSESRFRFMFEGHSSPMLLIEPDSGRIVSANAAAAAFYGYTVEQLQRMSIAEINTQTAEEVAAERQQALREERNYFVFSHRLADGSVRTVEVHSSPVPTDGKPLLFSIVHDITDRQQLEAQMREMAFYDALTRLPNRRLMLDRLGKALVSCSRTHRHGALMFLDLDNFKTLNDLHGHDIGDLLLVEVARRIALCIREDDSAARFGGDEFVVMLEGLSHGTEEAMVQAERVAEKLRAALAQPYELSADGTTPPVIHHCSSSIGVTLFRDHNESLDQLLRWTDMAMYRAKEAGRNTIRFFDPAMQTAIEQRAALEADLRGALEQGQFSLFYQVQVNAAGKPQGAEVLLRWQHPQRGMVSPAQFIPLAEEAGFIVPIGAWVLDTACARLAAWQDQLPYRDLSLSVNVSARQFRQTDFVQQVRATVARHGTASRRPCSSWN
ncbi:MAG: hypothetical protein Fur0026_08020 [Sideroxydans sp.]